MVLHLLQLDTRRAVVNVLFFALCFLCVTSSASAFDVDQMFREKHEKMRKNVLVDFRLVVEGIGGFVCDIKNKGDEDLVFSQASQLFLNANMFVAFRMDDPSSYEPSLHRNFIGELGGPLGNRYDVHLKGNAKHSWYLERGGSDWNSLEKNGRGRFSAYRWHLSPLVSSEIVIGVAGAEGEVATPLVIHANQTVFPILAFVLNDQIEAKEGEPEEELEKRRAPEVAFLMLNGSKEKVVLDQPLTSKKSRITVTSDALEKPLELVLSETDVKQVSTEAGQCGQWRLPWQTVLDLISKEDLKTIKDAGGEIDLVWQVGDLKSPVLPISLVVPEPAPKPTPQPMPRPLEVPPVETPTSDMD